MSLKVVLWIIAAILMIVSAFVSTPRVSLAALSWGLFILGWAVDGTKVD